MSKAGRPRGRSDGSVQLGQRLTLLQQQGYAMEQVAPALGLSASWCRELVRTTLADEAAFLASQPQAARSDAAGEDAADPAPIPRPAPKPLSQRALLWRAWTVSHMHRPAMKLSAEAKLFWISAVMAVGGAGDGFTLNYDEAGYEDRADFCALHDVPETVLDLIVRRRLLVDIEGGIALPKKLGLVPREPTYRPPDFALALQTLQRPGSSRAVRGQTEMLHVVPGGLSASATHPTERDGNIPAEAELNRRADAINDGKIAGEGAFSRRAEGNFPVADDLAGTAAAAATALEDLDSSLKSSSSSLSTAARDGKIAEPAELKLRNDGNIPAASDGNIPAATPAPEKALAEELARLAGLGSTLSTEELQAVAAWQAGGLTRDMMVAVVTKIVSRPKRPAKLRLLTYFNDAMADETRALHARPYAMPTAPALSAAAAPLSDEDQAIRALIQLPGVPYAHGNGSPFPPIVDSFKAAIARGDEALGHRWIAVFKVWDQAGRPGGGRPPDFTQLAQDRGRFERRLAEAEDHLTAPPSQATAD